MHASSHEFVGPQRRRSRHTNVDASGHLSNSSQEFDGGIFGVGSDSNFGLHEFGGGIFGDGSEPNFGLDVDGTAGTANGSPQASGGPAHFAGGTPPLFPLSFPLSPRGSPHLSYYGGIISGDAMSSASDDGSGRTHLSSHEHVCHQQAPDSPSSDLDPIYDRNGYEFAYAVYTDSEQHGYVHAHDAVLNLTMLTPDQVIAELPLRQQQEDFYRAKRDECEADDTRLEGLRMDYAKSMVDLTLEQCRTCDLCNRRQIGLGPWKRAIVKKDGVYVDWCRICASNKAKGWTTSNEWTMKMDLNLLLSEKNNMSPTLPSLSRGEIQMISPCHAYMTVTSTRPNAGWSGGQKISRKFSLSCTMILKDICENACEIPHAVADIGAFVTKSSKSDNDDVHRKAAGFHCNLPTVVAWLSHLLDNNKVWRQARLDGLLVVDTDRMDRLKDFCDGTTDVFEGVRNGALQVPVIEESELDDGTVASFRNGQHGIDQMEAVDKAKAGPGGSEAGSGDSEDERGHLLGPEESRHVINNLEQAGHARRVRSVVNPPRAATGGGQQPFLSPNYPGIEALVWPHFYPEGEQTFSFPDDDPDKKRFKNRKDYVKHILGFPGNTFTGDDSFAAVNKAWVQTSARKQTCYFALQAKFRNLDLNTARQMVADNNPAIFQVIKSYNAEEVGTDGYLARKRAEANAVQNTMEHVQQVTPSTFSTQSLADGYQIWHQAAGVLNGMSRMQTDAFADGLREAFDSGSGDINDFVQEFFLEHCPTWPKRWTNLQNYNVASKVEHAHLDALGSMRHQMLRVDSVVRNREKQGRLINHEHATETRSPGSGLPRPASIGTNGRPYYRDPQFKYSYAQQHERFIGYAGDRVAECVDDWDQSDWDNEEASHPGFKDNLQAMDPRKEDFVAYKKRSRADPSTHPAARCYPGGGQADSVHNLIEEETRQALLQEHVCSVKRCIIPAKLPYPAPKGKHEIVVCVQDKDVFENDGPLLCDSDYEGAVGDAIKPVLSSTARAAGEQLKLYTSSLSKCNTVVYLECSPLLAKTLIDRGELVIAGCTFSLEDDTSTKDKKVCKNRYPATISDRLRIVRSYKLSEGNGASTGRVQVKPAVADYQVMQVGYQGYGLYGLWSASNSNCQLLLPGCNFGYLFKYELKESKEPETHLAQLKSVVDVAFANGIDGASSALPYVQQVVEKLAKEKSIPAIEVYEYFNMPAVGLAVVSKGVVSICVGGDFGGFAGETTSVHVDISPVGLNAAPTKMTPLAIYGKRFWNSIAWAPNCSPEVKSKAKKMTCYTFTSSFELVTAPGEKPTLCMRADNVGVRVIPSLGPSYAAEESADGELFISHVDGDFAKQALYLHSVWEWPDQCNDAAEKLAAVADVFEANHAGGTDAKRWLDHCARQVADPDHFGTEGLSFALEGQPPIRMHDLLVPLMLLPPNPAKQRQREANIASMANGTRSREDGAGSSEHPWTDFSDTCVVPAAAAADDDDVARDAAADVMNSGYLSDDLDLEQPIVDGQFPAPPAGAVFHNTSGMLGSDEIIAKAEAYLAKHRKVLEDWTKDRRKPKPDFDPTYLALHSVPDQRHALEGKQKMAVMYLEKCLRDNVPCRLLLVGGAGTGKSFTIAQLAHAYRAHYNLSKLEAIDKFRVVAPTGVAALNCFGQTIHSFGDIASLDRKRKNDSERAKYKDGSSGAKSATMEGLGAVVIDEAFMVGSGLMEAFDDRMSLEKGATDQVFGGIQVLIMCGDYYQLPPVQDGSACWPTQGFNLTEARHGVEQLYKPAKDGKVTLAQGATAYHTVKADAVIYLDEFKRATDPVLQRVLGNARSGDNTEEDLASLKTRTKTGMSATEWDGHYHDPNTVHVYTTNIEVDRHNNSCIKNMFGGQTEEALLERPIKILVSEHAGPQKARAAQVGTQDAGGIPHSVPFRRGAKIMLGRNQITEAGLVNGSIGWLLDLGISETRPRPDNLPNVVLVLFKSDEVSLPSFGVYRDDNGDEIMYTDAHGVQKSWVVVPITPMKTVAFNGKVPNNKPPNVSSRVGYPMTLAYALTVHKTQGTTCDLVAAHLPFKASPGIDYVAWSRVRRLLDLIIVEDCEKPRKQGGGMQLLDMNRLQRIGYVVVKGRKPVRKPAMALKIGEEEVLRKRSEHTVAALQNMYDAIMIARRAQPAPAPRSSASSRSSSGSLGSLSGPRRRVRRRMSNSPRSSPHPPAPSQQPAPSQPAARLSARFWGGSSGGSSDEGSSL